MSPRAAPAKRPLAQWLDEIGLDQTTADLMAGDLNSWWYDHETGEFHPIPREHWQDAGQVKQAVGWGWPVSRDSRGPLFRTGYVYCKILAARAAKHAGGPKLKYDRESVTDYLKGRIRDKNKLPTHTKLWHMAERYYEDRNLKSPSETCLKNLATKILNELSHKGH